MHRQRNFLLFIALAAAVATPAVGQTVTLGVGLSILTDCGLAGSCYNFKMIRERSRS